MLWRRCLSPSDHRIEFRGAGGSGGDDCDGWPWAEYWRDRLRGVVGARALRILSVAAVVLVSVLVGLTFGLVPPELGASLSEMFRSGSSRESDDAPDDA
jgi:hypothetical protein